VEECDKDVEQVTQKGVDEWNEGKGKVNLLSPTLKEGSVKNFPSPTIFNI